MSLRPEGSSGIEKAVEVIIWMRPDLTLACA
eukprot:CAMPEP_0173376306 /NCGR_PEP_ID=MMETSP1144-20121109/30099_1 /TAXON_ID=483371 /ORGANISM="non described non described, Strain CCMP2298" /LENGTH=30 /DNA_ID= /DNA_START= /DNA_END= /DNA_ORIENTATION=